MDCLYRKALGNVHALRKCDVRLTSPFRSSALRNVSSAIVLASLLSGCDNTPDSKPANTDASEQVIASEILADPGAIQPVAQTDNQTPAQQPDNNGTQTDPSNEPSGLSEDEARLIEMLQTRYEYDGERIVPITGWICTDVFDTNRIYYFYAEGILDSSRPVVVERSLIGDNGFDDINFFWSVSGSDSLMMSSAVAGTDGELLSTGQQYDVHTIRFTEVDSVQTFSAQSLLRGKLVCAAFDLN